MITRARQQCGCSLQAQRCRQQLHAFSIARKHSSPSAFGRRYSSPSSSSNNGTSSSRCVRPQGVCFRVIQCDLLHWDACGPEVPEAFRRLLPPAGSQLCGCADCRVTSLAALSCRPFTACLASRDDEVSGYTPAEYISFSEDDDKQCHHTAEIAVDAPAPLCYSLWADWTKLMDWMDLVAQVRPQQAAATHLAPRTACALV